MIQIKSIDAKRFEALAGLSRSPIAAYVGRELAWFANDEETLIGAVILDLTDDDFAAVVLARDEGGRFRWIDGESSMDSQEVAEGWLCRALRWHTGNGPEIHAQGDLRQGPDLFIPVVSREQLHPDFVSLMDTPFFIAARRMISEMMPHFIDVDGNFVQQFQTTGFDARIWELYLFAYLSEEGLLMDRTRPSPDFLVTDHRESAAIEAVIVGRKADNPPRYLKGLPQPKTPAEIRRAHENRIPILFGSPLYTKLQKKYWDLPHVRGLPLVFAIADFHDDQSMLWTSTALINYLYGVRHDWHHDENGKLVISPITIDKHIEGYKEIPSGFFLQPDAQHIGGVLFSNSGTISKFNRIGRQAGFFDPSITMIRMGTCHNHDPDASLPNTFSYTVDETSSETWGEGLSLFHNPNALIPVPERLFPTIAHHRYADGQIVSRLPEFYPYGSVTHSFKAEPRRGGTN